MRYKINVYKDGELLTESPTWTSCTSTPEEHNHAKENIGHLIDGDPDYYFIYQHLVDGQWVIFDGEVE